MKKARPKRREQHAARSNRVAWVVGFLFLVHVALVTCAHFLKSPNWLSSATGFSISKLGALGDSFGPLTALFAAFAAVGAWRSFRAQSELLEDERNRHRGTRFDETFFRLIDHYERQVAALQVLLPDDHLTSPGVQVGPQAIKAFMNETKVTCSLQVAICGEKLAFTSRLEKKEFEKLRQLRDQEVAITRWLNRQSLGVRVSYRGALLAAKLTEEELWFWQSSVKYSGDKDLERFLTRFGFDRTNL